MFCNSEMQLSFIAYLCLYHHSQILHSGVNVCSFLYVVSEYVICNPTDQATTLCSSVLCT